MTIRHPLVLLLSLLIAAPGCATMRSGQRTAATTPAPSFADRTVLAEYVQRLPPGAALRIDLANGRGLRATLMKTSGQSMIVQTRTRIPEPPIDIPFDEVLRVTLVTSGGTNVGKAIGIGIAAGAGAALAVFIVIVALLSD